MTLEIIEHRPFQYAVRAPAEMSTAEPKPLLCFLHGYDEGPPTPIEAGVSRHGPLSASTSTQLQDQFVIVAPQLPVRGDLWWRYSDTVCESVSSIARRFNCDRSRFYLSGFSFGGNGVFDLAGAQPQLWAALWAVDPTRVPARPVTHPLWISAGEIARRQTLEFQRQLQLKDFDSEPDAARVWLDEEQDHVGSARRAYADHRIYEWLLRHRSDGMAQLC